MKLRRIALGVMVLPLIAVAVVKGPERVYSRVRHRLERGSLIMTGRLVDVGGHRLYLERRGRGGPTVVLDAGLCQ